MTVYDLQELMIEKFKTLNEESGIEFLNDTNVQYPNQSIEKPENKRWFELYFMYNDPKPIGILNSDKPVDRITGIMQINICVPLNNGVVEASNKVKWISRLFRRGQFLSDNSLLILNVSRSDESTEDDHYRVSLRINFEAEIDVE